jgi:hypothetical protein
MKALELRFLSHELGEKNAAVHDDRFSRHVVGCLGS